VGAAAASSRVESTSNRVPLTLVFSRGNGGPYEAVVENGRNTADEGLQAGGFMVREPPIVGRTSECQSRSKSTTLNEEDSPGKVNSN
jgi:hypothetical protein